MPIRFPKRLKPLIFFIILLAFTYILALIFGSRLPLWENVELILRKHALGISYQLPPFQNLLFQLLTIPFSLITFLDNLLPFFPSRLKLIFWDAPNVYVMLISPVLVILAILLLKIRNWKSDKSGATRLKITFLVLFLLWIIPVSYIYRVSEDFLVTKANFNIITPISTPYEWLAGTETPYTQYTYSWTQKDSTKDAKIRLSCLGHYQLFVNNQSVYQGPSFAVLPKIYYDEIDLAQLIKQGKNEIKVICNFVPEVVHEYPHYPQPALLVGGYVSNGLFKQDLADHRFWKTSTLENYQNNQRLSQDAGYSEKFNLTTQSNNFQTSAQIKLKYQAQIRPLPLLKTVPWDIKQVSSDVYGLTKHRVGYLTIRSNLVAPCEIKIIWGAKLVNNLPEPYFGQVDLLTLPIGQFKYHQFSRRAGRYFQIDSKNCLGEIKPSFNQVGMEFAKPTLELELQDQGILQLSLDTLQNNLQDHFEDSGDREKAMYSGDTLAISKCLLTEPTNAPLIKEMLIRFADSQRPDGSFPSMTPSGKDQFIPSYALQWAAMLELYLESSQDPTFANQMKPHLDKLLTWATQNESPEGFIYNKSQNPNWWEFIDWTPQDTGLTYSTSLQLWYYKALISANKIHPNPNLDNKINQLKANLTKYALDPQTNIWSDSFNLNQKSRGGLITNALAAKFELMDQTVAKKSLTNFTDYHTHSPFSQTWVIDWMIKAGEDQLALNTIRSYWGAMVNEGATAIYETYKPGFISTQGSYSHAWGCGPIYLYKKLDKDQNLSLLSF